MIYVVKQCTHITTCAALELQVRLELVGLAAAGRSGRGGGGRGFVALEQGLGGRQLTEGGRLVAISHQ